MPSYLGYMTAAYMILWAAILVYFLRLSQREKAIWEELQALRTRSLDRARQDYTATR